MGMAGKSEERKTFRERERELWTGKRHMRHAIGVAESDRIVGISVVRF